MFGAFAGGIAKFLSPQEQAKLRFQLDAKDGDLLFFVEGHTELATDCCATIAAHFRDHPQSRIA